MRVGTAAKYYAVASPEKATRGRKNLPKQKSTEKKYTSPITPKTIFFLPMKTQHEWERVICAASQGDKIGIDCSDTNEFGGPSMGFPHSNGREAADPFSGKDLNVFEYQKSTGPSLGIKIDLIADWVVTQARGCPSRKYLRTSSTNFQRKRKLQHGG